MESKPGMQCLHAIVTRGHPSVLMVYGASLGPSTYDINMAWPFLPWCAAASQQKTRKRHMDKATGRCSTSTNWQGRGTAQLLALLLDSLCI
jgi:hypothetical protein